MNKNWKIGIRLFWINTLDIRQSKQVTGDEIIARSWQKYLQRREDVEKVYLYGPNEVIYEELDVLIHFHPGSDVYPKTRNILYLQNAFTKETHPDKTVGVFHAVKDRYQGYLFTSQKLMEACAPGGVIPFATDPDVFFPQPSGIEPYPVSFVGNGNVRSSLVNQRYFTPALPFGLVIYGNMWSAPLSQACQGNLAPQDLPTLYSNSLINLNAHISEHAEWDTINLRIFDILACEGFILSDYVGSLANTLGDTVVYTEGYEDEWAKIVRYLAEPEERRKRSREGRKLVLNSHTYAHRMESVVSYLKEIV